MEASRKPPPTASLAPLTAPLKLSSELPPAPPTTEAPWATSESPSSIERHQNPLNPL